MAYNGLGKHCRHFAQLGHCHYGNSCKFLHERGPNYQPSDRGSQRNYHSLSDRNSNNFKITISNQSSSLRHPYSRSKPDRDNRDRERERDRMRPSDRSRDRDRDNRDSHRDRDRDRDRDNRERDRDRDNKSKYSGTKRSRDDFEKKHSDKSHSTKDKDTIKERVSPTKKVPEPPAKKLRRISRNDDTTTKDATAANAIPIPPAHAASVTTRKLRRIVRKPNESELSDGDMNEESEIMNIVTKASAEEMHPISEASRKRKIVRNSEIHSSSTIPHIESEKEKIAEIIKETQSQRLKYKEKVKKLETDKAKAKAKALAAFSALVLPPTPAILNSPVIEEVKPMKSIQSVVKSVIKSVKEKEKEKVVCDSGHKRKENKKRRRKEKEREREREREKERERERERKYMREKRRRRRSESSESSSSYHSDYSSSDESDSESESVSSDESEIEDRKQPIVKKIKEAKESKIEKIEINGNVKIEEPKEEETEKKMEIEMEKEKEKKENDNKKEIENASEMKKKEALKNRNGLNMIRKYLKVPGSLLGQNLSAMMGNDIKNEERLETVMKGTNCDDTAQRYYLILNSGHFV